MPSISKDVKLPHSMQRAMAKEAEANREALAKVSAASGHPSYSERSLQFPIYTVILNMQFTRVHLTRANSTYVRTNVVSTGDRRRRREAGFAGAERGGDGDERKSVGAAAALPADAKRRRHRARVDHLLPASHEHTRWRQLV